MYYATATEDVYWGPRSQVGHPWSCLTCRHFYLCYLMNEYVFWQRARPLAWWDLPPLLSLLVSVVSVKVIDCVLYIGRSQASVGSASTLIWGFSDIVSEGVYEKRPRVPFGWWMRPLARWASQHSHLCYLWYREWECKLARALIMRPLPRWASQHSYLCYL
jgi:hypothetical protein